jgi:Tfp pilus assembly PilM family ATPase
VDPGVLDGYARALAAALKETAQFYASMNARRPVETIHLAGGNALLPGLDHKLAELLGLPVSLLDLTRALHYSPAGSHSLSSEALHHSAPQLAVALGLLYWGNGDV